MTKYYKIITTNSVELNMMTYIEDLVFEYIEQTDTYIVVKIYEGNIGNNWNGYEMIDVTNEYEE
jgi:hypothetical protein